MKLPRRSFLHLAAGVAAMPAAARMARAQAYPSRQITMIVPFAAGGPADTVARIMAERMRATLGQTVVIENVAGAGGSLGVGRIARAAPDWLHVRNGHLQHAAGGDPQLQINVSGPADVDAAAARIKAAGGALLSEPADRPWGARMFQFNDMDGFKLGVSTPLVG